MRYDQLRQLYQRLRCELDAAYAARPWDGTHIDRIAEELLNLERTLSTRQGGTVPPAVRHPAPDLSCQAQPVLPSR